MKRTLVVSAKAKGVAVPAEKVSFLAYLERDGRVYTKVVEQIIRAEELMRHIRAKTRKGSVYYTDAFRGYRSVKR